jgi:predicted P-loop ATPase
MSNASFASSPGGNSQQGPGNTSQGQGLHSTGKTAKPDVTPANVRLAILMDGITVRYDAFACHEIIDGLPGHGPELDDAAMTALYILLWQRHDLKPGWEDFKRVVRNIARENTFHPVKIYLDSLTWNGKPRLDTWLHVYGNAEPTAFVSQVGALTLMAAVKRIYEPGCKFDEMLVLENPKQGGNKSSAWAVLAVKRQWFLDDLPLAAMTREVLEKTRGKWIAEASEMVGMQQTPKSITKVKNFLSRQTDEARWVYKDTVIHKPREFINVGSTNETNWMFDSTGNRRFWPVRAGPFDLEKLERDRDQLWAEAVYRIKHGASIRLDEKF